MINTILEKFTQLSHNLKKTDEKERIKSYHNLIFYGIENSNLHANSPYFFMRDYQGGELVFFFARWVVLAVIALLWAMHFVFVLF